MAGVHLGSLCMLAIFALNFFPHFLPSPACLVSYCVTISSISFLRFSISVSAADLNEQETGYKNMLMAAINYVYPIIGKFPVTAEKGSVGATLKIYNISTYNDDGSDRSVNVFSFDIGCIYDLDFIDND